MAPSSDHSLPDDNNTIDFRAPPPSPIASGRRSFVANDDILTEFLEHSLRVPDLILPDKIFPRQKIVETPPVIDFQLLNAVESDSVPKILDSISRIGCFQLVNYGVPSDFIRLVLAMAAGIFRVSQEKKAAVIRCPEKPYGFEEVHAEEECCEPSTEEFVWCRDQSLKLDMEGIWPTGYTNFSEKMETLLSDVENVAKKILLVLPENSPSKSMYRSDVMQGQDPVGSVCYLHKHRQNIPEDQWATSLGYDVIRMLVRGSDYSHALCLHISDGSSEFHVYSKKGWVSFCPEKDALIVTVGDQTQALSGGQYKHVLGRPIFKGEKEDCISMAFLYCPPTTIITNTSCTTTNNPTTTSREGRTISLGQQVIMAIILALAYNLLAYIYKKF